MGLKTDGTLACWEDNTYGEARADSVPLSTAVTAAADFTDPDITDSHTALLDWGDGDSSVAAVTETSGAGSATATHRYATPGVYTLTITVTDSHGGGCGLLPVPAHAGNHGRDRPDLP